MGEDEGAVQFPWRPERGELNRLRKMAKLERRSMNAVLSQAFREYVSRRMKGERRGKMRWVIDGWEYNTETATVIAHSGRDRYSGLRENELFRTPEGEYFMVRQDEEEGAYIVTLHAQEAYDTYLELPFHVVAEDEAFDLAEDDEEQEEEAPVS